MITNVQLTTKEKFLLEDSKTHEEECILKYENYANLANGAELKAVFRSNGQKEQEHLQTINQLLSGKVPSMGQSNSQGNQNSQGGSSSSVTSQQSTVNAKNMANCGFNASDKDLCIDMLMTEKYVSGAYDTAIFEFKDASVRDVLNHIQKEEQQHGESIFKYMESNGMYQVQ